MATGGPPAQGGRTYAHEIARTITANHELIASIIAGLFLLTQFILSRIAALQQAAGTPDAVRHSAWCSTTGEVFVYLSLGIGLYYGGLAAVHAIRHLQFNIDVLMVLGAVLAAGLGHPDEGALLLFLFVLSGALEELAMRRTRSAITALTRMIPTETRVRRDGGWAPVHPEELRIDDIVLVRTGERAPADGQMTSGSTEFNQASLTGESMPRSVTVGDDVFAGTINEGHPVELRVTREAKHSSLQRVLDMVKTAQEDRQPIARLIDRLSMPYSVTVVVVALAAFFILYLGLGRSLESASYTAITLLIVASPCALIIATPTATLSGISRAARGGVLLKGGETVERLAGMQCLAMDKTGTLTMGQPALHELHPVAWSDADRLLALAAGLEQGSTHPLAHAILEAAKERNLEPAGCSALRFVPGRGVAGEWQGEEVRLGKYAFVEELMPICLRANVHEVMDRSERAGSIAVTLAWRDQAGVFTFHDAMRPGGSQMAQELHRQNIRPLVMLTGDVRGVAQQVSEALQLDDFQAELLPEDKLRIVDLLRQKHGRVGVLGDGVNDAPSLAASDVGIALGGIGSDAALETADAILLNEDLRSVSWVVRLARATTTTITINLVFALGAIVLLAIGTLTGFINLTYGVIGHEGGTLLVVGNSLRLLWFPAANIEVAEKRRGAARWKVIEYLRSGATADENDERNASGGAPDFQQAESVLLSAGRHEEQAGPR